MRLTRIQLTDFRRFETLDWCPAPGLNLLLGDNGAGKTSVLEAAHLLAYGRSFRGRVGDGLVRDGAQALAVYAEWEELNGRLRRAGLRHGGSTWEGRLDGQPVTQLGELCAALAVVTFEPGSHVLVSGGGEPRRRLMDWGLFHVEPDFLRLWRRYSRALKQRNFLLKAGKRDAQLEAWEHELVEAGEPLTLARIAYLEAWQPMLVRLAAELAPSLGIDSLTLQPGWRRGDLALADALLLSRDRDLATGFTSVGPHRADWQVQFGGVPGRHALSRGQAKLTALALLLAQAQLHAERSGDWPVLGMDDLGSELDQQHQRRLLDWLVGSGAQVLITGNHAPAFGAARPVVFHVEHGGLQRQS